MSAYSSLKLIANADVVMPSRVDFLSLCLEIGVIEPDRAERQFGNLATDLMAFFLDHPRKAENEKFFVPDTITLYSEIEVGYEVEDGAEVLDEDEDGDYVSDGCLVSIHGNGYFWPLKQEDMLSFINLPKLQRLRVEMEKRFGGRFAWPEGGAGRGLSKMCVLRSEKWCWFASESY